MTWLEQAEDYFADIFGGWPNQYENTVRSAFKAWTQTLPMRFQCRRAWDKGIALPHIKIELNGAAVEIQKGSFGVIKPTDYSWSISDGTMRRLLESLEMHEYLKANQALLDDLRTIGWPRFIYGYSIDFDHTVGNNAVCRLTKDIGSIKAGTVLAVIEGIVAAEAKAYSGEFAYLKADDGGYVKGEPLGKVIASPEPPERKINFREFF